MHDFNQAIAVNPNDAAAYLGRGNLLRAENDFTRSSPTSTRRSG